MRINIAIPEQHVKKPVLDGALEAVTRLNESLLEAGQTPTDEQLIAKGAIWKPEPPGQEHFDHGGIIAERGHGDCDDWAPLRAARLRVTGEDPGARAVVRKTGNKRWHATVLRSDGSEDDPSVDAGMRSRRPIGVHGAWLPLMQRPGVHGVHGGVKTPPIALRPVLDREGEIVGWQCRTDMPWSGDAAMVSTHGAQRSSSAVIGSLLGARDLAVCCGYGEPDELKRLSAIAEACEGAPWEDLAATYGAEHANAASSIVGSFFGKALRKIGKVAKGAVKLASPALSLVPGGSLATAAFNAASPTLKRAVMKQGHVPPKQRQPVRVSPLRDVPRANATPLQNRAHPGGGGPQWLPYPYPLPYPVPGWSQPSAGAEQPGLAWPRMT